MYPVPATKLMTDVLEYPLNEKPALENGFNGDGLNGDGLNGSLDEAEG